MYEDLDAVEYVSVGVVGVEGLVARHLGVGVVALHHVVVYDYAKRAAHYLVVDNRYHLSFGEDSDELLYLFARPEHVVVGVDALERLGELRVVFHPQVAQLHLVDFV